MVDAVLTFVPVTYLANSQVEVKLRNSKINSFPSSNRLIEMSPQNTILVREAYRLQINSAWPIYNCIQTLFYPVRNVIEIHITVNKLFRLFIAADKCPSDCSLL